MYITHDFIIDFLEVQILGWKVNFIQYIKGIGVTAMFKENIILDTYILNLEKVPKYNP